MIFDHFEYDLQSKIFCDLTSNLTYNMNPSLNINNWALQTQGGPWGSS